MTDKLNPCPYCGGKAEYKSRRTHRGISIGGRQNADNLQERFIRCASCHARTQAFGKIDNCINMWQSGRIYQR